jgi:flagellin
MTGVNLTGTTFTSLLTDSVGSIGDSTTGAIKALTDVKNAISELAADRASIGANIETLTDYNNQLGTLNNNLSAANSQIMDVDVAQESTNYAKYNILVPQTVLKLLS